MTPQKAAKWIREGMKLAQQFPERWIHNAKYLGWLMPSGGVHDRHVAATVGAVGACGCVLGLTELARANGTLPLYILPSFMGGGSVTEALGDALTARISSASEDSLTVPEMCRRVEAVLRKAGL